MRMSTVTQHFMGKTVTVDSAGYRFLGKLLAFEDTQVYERPNQVLKKAKEMSCNHPPALLVLEVPEGEGSHKVIVRGWSKMMTEALVQ
jgi:hypothetical protein